MTRLRVTYRHTHGREPRTIIKYWTGPGSWNDNPDPGNKGLVWQNVFSVMGHITADRAEQAAAERIGLWDYSGFTTEEPA